MDTEKEVTLRVYLDDPDKFNILKKSSMDIRVIISTLTVCSQWIIYLMR